MSPVVNKLSGPNDREVCNVYEFDNRNLQIIEFYLKENVPQVNNIYNSVKPADPILVEEKKNKIISIISHDLIDVNHRLDEKKFNFSETSEVGSDVFTVDSFQEALGTIMEDHNTEIIENDGSNENKKTKRKRESPSLKHGKWEVRELRALLWFLRHFTHVKLKLIHDCPPVRDIMRLRDMSSIYAQVTRFWYPAVIRIPHAKFMENTDLGDSSYERRVEVFMQWLIDTDDSVKSNKKFDYDGFLEAAGLPTEECSNSESYFYDV